MEDNLEEDDKDGEGFEKLGSEETKDEKESSAVGSDYSNSD